MVDFVEEQRWQDGLGEHIEGSYTWRTLKLRASREHYEN